MRHDPTTGQSPLVFDSPHSGTLYPRDFKFSCPRDVLRQAEDSFVDDLYAAAPKHGAVLLAAQFPRSYIDVNRAIDDIDPQLLATPWPATVRPSEKSRVGMGLVRRICRPGMPVYDHKLTVGEVQARIEKYYLPYHAELRSVIDAGINHFGAVWHINCHSMPSSSVGGSNSEWDRADFVLGNRDGTTCSSDFAQFVTSVLEKLGYTVRLNDPYKGVEIVRRYGKPAQGVHSLQIEINRRLYMNEDTIKPNAGYAKLKRDLTKLIAALRDYTNDQLLSAAAD
jgi:N-formylglutamate amidohydrolase